MSPKRIKKLGLFLSLAVALALVYLKTGDDKFDTRTKTSNRSATSDLHDRNPASSKNKITNKKPDHPQRDAATDANSTSGTKPPPHGQLAAKPLHQQPTINEITKATGLPGRAAAEVKFDVVKMMELAKALQPMDLEILPGRVVTVTPSNFRFENQFYHISGTINPTAGADATLTMDESGKILVGIIQDPPRSYQIVYSGHETSYVVEIATEKLPQVYEKDPQLQPPAQPEVKPKPNPFRSQGGSSKTSSYQPERSILKNRFAISPPSPIANPTDAHHFSLKKLILTALLGEKAMAGYVQTDANKTVRIFALYNSVLVGVNGGEAGTQAMIANQAAILNNTLANSSAGFQVVIAKYFLYDSALNSTDSFEPNTFKPTGELGPWLEEIRGKGDSADYFTADKIDLVHMFVTYGGTDACGKAYLGDMSKWNTFTSGSWGYGVTAYQCNYKYTFAHEVGHNLGLDHDIENAKTGRVPNQYNFGYTDYNAKQKTIMAYGNGAGCKVDGYLGEYTSNSPFSIKQYCTTVQYFSSGQAISGGTANNKKKLQDFSNNFFGPIRFVNPGHTAFNEQLKLTTVKNIAIKKGETNFSAVVGEDALQTYGPNASPVSMSPRTFTSFMSAYRNGQLADRVHLYNVDPKLADYHPPLVLGDVWEVRAENRFGYVYAKYKIAAIHTPLNLTGLTASHSGTIKSGTTVSFSLKQNDTNPAASCRWYVANQDSGVTGNSFSKALTPSGASQNMLIEARCVRNSLYGSNETKKLSTTLTVMNPPAITTQPEGVVVVASTTSTSLKVVASGASLTYKWYKNGTAIASSNTATLNLSGGPSALVGQYHVQVSSPVGSVKSTAVTISQYVPPGITLGVSDKININEGQTLNLSATVGGAPAPSVAWTYNSQQISSATTATVAGIKRTQSGVYTITAKNTDPTTKTVKTVSKTVTVNVLYKPTITTASTVTIDEGQTLNLSATVSANPAATVKWVFNNQQISSASSASVSAIKKDQAGTYTLTATNSVGSVSVPVSVNVRYKPEITTQPQAEYAPALGSSLTIGTVAKGNPTPTYQWFKIDDQGAKTAIGGATSASLMFPSVALSDEGTYVCEIGNALGKVTTSNAELKLPRMDKASSLSDVPLAFEGIDLSGAVKIISTGGFEERN